ncbi:MAG TPA: hypothetical protein VKP69_24835, partial [Isosphaeraceae bacterium]|nr:hypothetical protein [Isosphaeraceae bacterium]
MEDNQRAHHSVTRLWPSDNSQNISEQFGAEISAHLREIKVNNLRTSRPILGADGEGRGES